MHDILKKAHKAMEDAEGFNLEDVYNEEQAKRMRSKYYLLDLLVRSRGVNGVCDMLERYQRVEMSADEAEWVMAFLRAYGEIQEMRIPSELMTNMSEQIDALSGCDCAECVEGTSRGGNSYNSMEVA